MTVTIVLPKMLHDSVGAAKLRVRAKTLREAIEQNAALKMHVCDERGGLRTHVLCFRNGEMVRSMNVPLKDGDEIAIVQAISGG